MHRFEKLAFGQVIKFEDLLITIAIKVGVGAAIVEVAAAETIGFRWAVMLDF